VSAAGRNENNEAESPSMNEKNRSPSTAQNPDLDWSQIRETVRMLHLSVAQISMAMRDGDDSITSLSNSFATMIDSVKAIDLAAQQLPDEDDEITQAIVANCTTVTDQMHSAIVAFQFYDKLSQRLNHVNHSLEALANLVDDNRRLYNPYEWQDLQQKIRSQYSMREEQEMFDALLAGASIVEVLQLFEDKRRQGDVADNDIELF
jgi:hypothetical protein